MSDPGTEIEELPKLNLGGNTSATRDSFSLGALKKERKWEKHNIVHPNSVEYEEGLRYKYASLNEAPGPHLAILELAARGRNVQAIANLSGRSTTSVVKVLEHRPNAQWLERMRERVRYIREEADEKKKELAEQAFGYEAAVVTGQEKPDFVRLRAAQHAMSMDPHGRYELYSKEDKENGPLHGDNIVEIIQKAQSRFAQAIPVQAAEIVEDK
jgi:hypothetical protein